MYQVDEAPIRSRGRPSQEDVEITIADLDFYYGLSMIIFSLVGARALYELQFSLMSYLVKSGCRRCGSNNVFKSKRDI